MPELVNFQSVKELKNTISANAGQQQQDTVPTEANDAAKPPVEKAETTTEAQNTPEPSLNQPSQEEGDDEKTEHYKEQLKNLRVHGETLAEVAKMLFDLDPEDAATHLEERPKLAEYIKKKYPDKYENIVNHDVLGEMFDNEDEDEEEKPKKAGSKAKTAMPSEDELLDRFEKRQNERAFQETITKFAATHGVVPEQFEQFLGITKGMIANKVPSDQALKAALVAIKGEATIKTPTNINTKSSSESATPPSPQDEKRIRFENIIKNGGGNLY